MKRHVIVCAFMLSLAAPGAWGAQPKGWAKYEHDLTSLVREFTDAQKNYDAAALDRILAPDYVEVSPAGEVDSRARVLSFYAPEKKDAQGGALLSKELDEFSTRVYDGDAAVVIARMTFVARRPDGQTANGAFRCTFFFRRLSGKWRLASTQYTSIRPPAPPKQ